MRLENMWAKGRNHDSIFNTYKQTYHFVNPHFPDDLRALCKATIKLDPATYTTDRPENLCLNCSGREGSYR